MEYTVGVLSMKLKLRQLIENRLTAGQKIGGQIKIIEEFGSYVRIEVEDQEQTFKLADILADIIIENLQIRFIMQEITQNYYFLTEKEQCEVLVSAVKRLWYESEHEDLDLVKQDVSNRIAACMFEGKQKIISLDGIIRFRMQDLVQKWRFSIEESVEEYLVKIEKKEFISLLRYFVSMQEPAIDYVEVRMEAGEYLLLDDASVRIVLPPMEDEDEDATKEDLLLSQLINLAPEAINISEVRDENLKSLLQDIFIGRIRSE